MRLRFVVLGFLVLSLGSGLANAGADVAYGPVPESLAAIRGTASDEKLAAEALAILMREVETKQTGDALLDARSLLVLLEDVGLRHVGEQLSSGAVSEALLPHLLHVVSSASHAGADVFLAQAAQAKRTVTRMVAADGLAYGRSPLAVEALAALCRDPVPGVRAAALRALFAIDTEEAAQTRQSLPVDGRPDLHARRLRWHRLRGRAKPTLLPMARTSWERGRTPEERLEAARLLALPPLAAPLDVIEDIVTELGTDAVGASLTRMARGVVRCGYDRGEARLAAILAAFSGAMRGDDALKTRLVDRMVGWLAQPVRLGPYAKSVPEDVLRMVLPDWGLAVRDPTLRRLQINGFQRASEGVDLLLEALSPRDAAAALRVLVDPAAEPPVDTWVRVAAAGGLRQIERIGDESLARALLRESEEPIIRRHAVGALAADDADWAIPLLAELAAGDDEALTEDAVSTLELRGEDAARAVLVEHLFTRSTLPEVRMKHLVGPADEVAFEVLERALRHERAALRRSGLRQLHNHRVLYGDARALALLREYEQRTSALERDTHELQQVAYAFFAQAPSEGIRWMRDHWDEFRALGWDRTAMRSLQNAPRGEPGHEMVDLVLEKITGDVGPELLQEATTALEGRRGHRDEEVDAFWRRALSHDNEVVVLSAQRSLDHPGHRDLTDLLTPMLERINLTDTFFLPEAVTLLDVMRHQPAASGEPLLLRICLDANADPTLRQKAAVALLGRISDAGRAELLEWLLTEAAGQDDEAAVRMIARVVGTGGGEEVARPAADVARRLLLETYDTERSLDPEIPPEGMHGWHIGALARAVAYTAHEPSIHLLLELVFEDRFARYARRAVALQGRRLGPDDATSGGRVGPTVRAVGHRLDGVYSPIPWEVGLLLESLKPAPDEMLARPLQTILEKARNTGRLARFPDLHLDRVVAYLRGRLTGDRTQAAEVVERWVGIVEPVGGATDFGIARARVMRLAREARYAEAVEAQREVLSILARRAYDDDRSYRWRDDRAVLDAWRGAVAAARGDTAGAESLFAQAVKRHPYGSLVLTTTARARAQTGTDLETALRLADRGVQLERRLGDRVSYESADALALVLLELGRPGEAREVIESILRRVEQDMDPGGRYHRRAAQACLAVGDRTEAAKALLKALKLEPSLEADLRLDPRLAPFVEDGTLDVLVRKAEEEALAPSVE